MAKPQYTYSNSLTPKFKFVQKKRNNLDELINIYRLSMKNDLWSKFRLGPKIRTYDRHNPESASKIAADPQSTVFSKSTNPLDLSQKSAIRALIGPNRSIRKPIHPAHFEYFRNGGAKTIKTNKEQNWKIYIFNWVSTNAERIQHLTLVSSCTLKTWLMDSAFKIRWSFN